MSTSSKPHIAHELLGRAHDPETAAQFFTERVKHKPLHLRPTSPTPADNRSRRLLHRLRKKEYFLRKQKPKPLSAREKRRLGIYDLPKDECKYEVFKGLHRMWVEYMQEVLDLKREATADSDSDRRKPVIVSAQSHGSKLASADFHGAEIEVVRSRCSCRVGLKGVVVRDTKFTFAVVTEMNELKTVPKEHSIFRFIIPVPVTQSQQSEISATKELTFEIHGSQFKNRPVDRANKRFKWKNVDYL